MQVEGGLAENGTNVQQWGTTDGTVHDIWKTINAGDGYYYLVSGVGDGGTYNKYNLISPLIFSSIFLNNNLLFNYII